MIEDFAQRWEEIEPLLDQLLDVPGAERSAWLRRHGADGELSALVTQALDNAPRIDVLEQDIARCLPPQAREALDSAPSAAGYRVLRFVGAGGMASVFEAERALPGGAQTVALKLLRLDVHDPEERRRFLREQSILARLQHPHIAQLLDAGFTQAGTPFLALEFVTGSDLIAHCEQSGLDARARLALFIDVCAAVEHAHRNLIVHRDLKPRNVLVSANGCVKLVDFGIAKLLGADGEETRTDARRLTRRYAAPEQLAGGTATTAIDVYALGVLLAELLGVRRQRANEVGVYACATPEAFAFDAAAIRRMLGSDLHAVVCEATQADPLRRYPSVAALREDIERHLQRKPLRVRPHTFAYRAATFAKRHALAVAAGAAGAAILAGATGISVHEAHRAHRAASAANAQAQVAVAEARRADAVKFFLEGLFDSAAPGANASETAEELLARGRERAERDFAVQPALRIEILALVGDLERRSGHPDRAWQPLERAAALANAQFGPADRRTLHVEYLLAKDADELGSVRDAAARLQRALESFHIDPDSGSQEEVQALAWLAGLDERLGASATAIKVGERSLELARRALPNDSTGLTEAVLNLGWILLDAGHSERAEPLLREALARRRHEFGDRHADVADAMAILSSALVHRGRYDEGERLLREALDVDASVYAHPHPRVGWHLNDLANVLALESKLDEAVVIYAKAIELDRAVAPVASLNEAVSLGNLARIRYRQGEYADAEAGFRDAIERKQHLLGPDYGDNGRGYDHACLAEILIARGRFAQARTLVDDALSDARHRHAAAHPDIAFSLMVDAELMAALGQREDAAASAANAVATYAALSDLGSDKAIRARLLLGDVLQSLGRDGEAKTQFEGALIAAKAISPHAEELIAQAANKVHLVGRPLGDNAAAGQSTSVSDPK